MTPSSARDTRSWHRPVLFAVLAFALHLPFVVRYDLHFQPDFAVSVLMSRAIVAEGDRPIFFWFQGYLGTYGCYLTALLFRIFGVSIALAALVSLTIWASGVGLTTALAERFFGRRGAVWAGTAAAVASPFANHYMAQPYSSYETAPVLAVLVIAALGWGRRLLHRPLSGRTVAGWLGLGLLLGFAWWTTRLFLPVLVAALLAVVACARWRVPRWRTVVALVLLLAGAAVGDAPELHYRLGDPPTEQKTPSFVFASAAQIPTNLAQAARGLPAYLNGDPRARLPEGAGFANEIALGRDPRAAETMTTVDALVIAGLVAILLAAGYTAFRAWRARDVPLLALCASPFVHFAAIGLSAQTAGGYYEARRYWFAVVLLLPLLVANAIVLAERGPAALRWGARIFGAVLLLSSALAQARMLALPDELADYRILAQDLVTNGEQAAWMSNWNAWVVAALSGGQIDVAAPHYNRRPEMTERVVASPRLAVIVRANAKFVDFLQLGSSIFRPEDAPPRAAGHWQWRPYRRLKGPGGALSALEHGPPTDDRPQHARGRQVVERALERVAIDHDQVGVASGRERPEAVPAEHAGGVAGPHGERLDAGDLLRGAVVAMAAPAERVGLR
jgi:hypothetical protein